VAGIAGFKSGYVKGRNASADLLYRWADTADFTCLISEEILDEYKEGPKEASGAWPTDWADHQSDFGNGLKR
jgi:hypothetical protein